MQKLNKITGECSKYVQRWHALKQRAIWPFLYNLAICTCGKKKDINTQNVRKRPWLSLYFFFFFFFKIWDNNDFPSNWKKPST